MTDNLPIPAPDDSGAFLLYQTEDGRTRIEVRVEGETVWLPQKAMAELFQTSVPNINQHLKAIYDEGELQPEATIKQYLIVQTEGKREVRRAVDHYLEFAELQALNRRPMHMADWIDKLDDFLRLSDRDILTHAGKISHEDAREKAEAEFALYRKEQAALPQPVDQHFEQSLDELKKIEGRAKESKKTSGKQSPKKKAAKKKSPRKKRSDD